MALLVLICAGPVGAQEVYKSIDANGNVVYSDRGATKNAQTTAVHVTEGNAQEAARLAREQQMLNAADRQRQKQDASEEKAKESADRYRQHACETARNKYYRYKDAGRLFKRDADGNRVWLSDDDADDLREQARKAMVSACGS
ncbi:MAG: DUF4124 domain-containing protein [Proteobacteria bacterium]|nr:DUF4124 domain-containing protein [Pseudomonadota bacterium]